MKRKQIIGTVFMIIGAIMINWTLFLKKNATTEFYNFELTLGASVFILIGCYFMYKAKKAKQEKERQS
jgi:amino acid permease